MGQVECIANFSEGRRPEVIGAIRDAIAAVPGVIVLDVQSDGDHHRTVISFAGPADGVGEAAFQAVKTAQGLINLDEHKGEHPRIGASDVVPFVPLAGTTMAECVALAREVGRRIGEELGIAVYLYEEAASRPERRNLADVRRGEYEGWKEAVASDPAREPDFGPAKATPAGATVVGARQPLIAYNVYLNTSDVTIAQKIGKSIRHLGGGLRYVKALGMLVDGRAQISMNLVNYKGTPIHRVQELIRAEAARYGVTITEGEVIGLLPQEALVAAAEHYLQLNRFERDQILEQKLASAERSESGGGSWVPSETLRAFAAGAPTPGGGSASALAGALAASLGQMVANLTVGRKKYAAVEPQMRAALDRLERLGAELGRLALSDSAAFDAMAAANKLPANDEGEAQAKEAAVQAATLEAAQVPLATARKAVEVLEALRDVARDGNPNARTDAEVGGYLAHAACMGATANVLVNLPYLTDASQVAALKADVAALRAAAGDHLGALSGS